MPTPFLRVAHHRHALLAQLAHTAPLLLLRALHVALVQVLAHLLRHENATLVTLSPITHAQAAPPTPTLLVAYQIHALLARQGL